MTKDLILPSRIDWQKVKGHALEESVYWLLDAIGAKNLDWRIGGVGDGAADGGRDLECDFHLVSPDGGVQCQRWWIEVKGRSGPLKRTDIQSSVLSSSGRSDVDVHLIVTNQRLSNPTKDWIANYSQNHPRPKIITWERHDLERLVSKHPNVAVRVFPGSLTLQGKCEVTVAEFWERVWYCDVPTLEDLWANRADLDFDAQSIFAVIASECANGDLSIRPWAASFNFERAFEVYVNSLLNGFYLLSRASKGGVSNEPIVRALANLLGVLILEGDPELIARVTEKFSDLDERTKWITEESRKLICDPVINTLLDEAGEECASDCSRVCGWRTRRNEKEGYFWRKFQPSKKDSDQEEEASRFFISLKSAPCKVGLDLGEDITCPFIDDELPLAVRFEMVKAALAFRCNGG